MIRFLKGNVARYICFSIFFILSFQWKMKKLSVRSQIFGCRKLTSTKRSLLLSMDFAAMSLNPISYCHPAIIDVSALEYLVSPPLLAFIVPGLYRVLDENSDGHLDFKEITCEASSVCCGPLMERLKCKERETLDSSSRFICVFK